MMMNTTKKNLTTNPSKVSNVNHVHIFKVEDHDKHKPLLLESIHQYSVAQNLDISATGRGGFLTDFYVDHDKGDPKARYKHIIDDILDPYYTELEETYGIKLIQDKGGMWFQQYTFGSDFGWHTHNGHLAMVYYIELPDPTEATEFLNYSHFNLVEGDVIFFPPMLMHRSPPIKNNTRKTVVSKNLHFTADRDLVKLYGLEYFKH